MEIQSLNETINLVRSETKERERIKNNVISRGLDENDYSNDDLLHKCNELLNELHVNINIHQLARGHALPPAGFCGRHNVNNIEKGRSPPGIM